MKTNIIADRSHNTLTLTLPSEIVQDLRKIAAAKGTDIRNIVNSYIFSGIAQDSLEVRRMRFAHRAHEKLGKGHNPPDTFKEIFPDLLY